jgi:peptide deformylase
VTNMYDTMYYTGNGVGLAGNQVGEEKSVIVMDLTVSTDSPFKQPVTMINPEITSFSDEEIEMQEGCLSIPEYYENVVRPAGIEISYWDLEMKEHKREVDGFLARVMQHEVDHLNGILIFDKISPLKRTLARSKFKKLQKGQVIPKYPMVQPDGTYTDGKED